MPETRKETVARAHAIVNMTTRGVLGGWCHHCSCGASINEPEGGHEAVVAHLAGPPSPPRPTIKERLKTLMGERDSLRAQVNAQAAAIDALADVDGIARVLLEHSANWWGECACGRWQSNGEDGRFANHVAAAVVAWMKDQT